MTKDTGFTYTGSGTNSQGNHWCARQGNSGGDGYHYSNKDDSFYYKNPNGSTYHDDGNGNTRYTAPNGETTITNANGGGAGGAGK